MPARGAFPAGRCVVGAVPEACQHEELVGRTRGIADLVGRP
jgi:hypothetical protein